jgi:ABC-2 type transport system ATP-binding protein
MPDDVIIETRNLTKVYRDFWGRQKVRALKALDLEVRRGEIFGLLGPNGSGKTTTIKLLLGLLFPTSGQALVFGRDATEVTKNERIGYLPEESYLYKFLSAEETLDFYGRLFKMSRALRRQRTAELIEQVGLVRARRRQLREYSKGMTRRIGLAQALINDPELILLDEPTTGLDPLGTRDMKNLILSLRDRGKTVVMCSHRLDDVQDVCDRIAILYEGELKELGRVDALLKVRDVTDIAPRKETPIRSKPQRGDRDVGVGALPPLRGFRGVVVPVLGAHAPSYTLPPLRGSFRNRNHLIPHSQPPWSSIPNKSRFLPGYRGRCSITPPPPGRFWSLR